MAETTNLNIKIDRELKAQADSLFNKMGERTLKDVLRETRAQARLNGTSELTTDDIIDIIAELTYSPRINSGDFGIQTIVAD